MLLSVAGSVIPKPKSLRRSIYLIPTHPLPSYSHLHTAAHIKAQQWLPEALMIIF